MYMCSSNFEINKDKFLYIAAFLTAALLLSSANTGITVERSPAARKNSYRSNHERIHEVAVKGSHLLLVAIC